MRVVLLGAGYGTRLAAVLGGAPKILAPIAGRPLLAWQLEYLARAGATDVILNVHHEAERIIAFLSKYSSPIPVQVSVEEDLLGTAGALGAMRGLLDEAFLLLYGDVATDAPLRDVMAAHMSSSNVATLTYYDSAHLEGKGLLRCAGGRVVGFAEKTHEGARQGKVNAGIYALDPTVVGVVSDGSDFGHDVWPSLLQEGAPIGAYDLGPCYVRDVGSPQELLALERDLADGTFRW